MQPYLDSKLFNDYVTDMNALIRYPDKEYLNEIIKIYPFFQTAQLLNLVANQQEEGFIPYNLLYKTAIYITERAKLYHYLNKKFDTVMPDTANLPKETEKTDEAENTSYYEPKPASNKIQREVIDSIVDKFIETSPSVRRPTAEFYSATHMASRSISDDEDLATETLAKIHVKQGNYQKGIQIYEKLMLLYPEKSSFFAEIIEGLKDKISE